MPEKEVDANQLIVELLKMNQTLLRTSLELQVRILTKLEGKSSIEFNKELQDIVAVHKEFTQNETLVLYDFLKK
ncbi:hypothetical protein V9L05_18255 [Bernardetia sp. Wsw4-3y2]|uniref:hypothetical protein n=1 Tax=Bernardetia sp. Wsw4-3y2 TaxID=3127471 RepID=UPI0030D2D8BE